MGYTVTFENGKSVTFETEPTEADIDEVAAQMNKPKETSGFWDSGSWAHGGYEGLKNLGTAATSAFVGLQESMPEWLRSREYQGADKSFDAMRQMQKEMDEKQKAALEGKELGMGGAIASGLAQVPFYAGPQSALAIAGSGFQRGQQVLEEGGDLGDALRAHGVSTLTNAVFQGLPPSLRGPLVSRILSGAALGLAGVPIEPALVNAVRHAAGLPPLPLPELKDYIAGAALGGGTGAAHVQGGRGKAKTEPPAPQAESPAAEILKNRPEPPPEPAPEVSSISPEGMGPEAPPNPYGDLPRLDTLELPPTLPEAPQRPTEVPQIREIADQVPLLPETPVARETGPGETPLPKIDPRLAGAEDAAGIMSLQETPPVNDGGVRHIDPDTGKVVQGMDASVPTIDFPLRQEVLQRPEVKAAITRFKKRWEEASSPAAKAKVEADFANYMSRFGITDAADAHGLGRGMYEPLSAMEARRPGERNPAKSEMPGNEGLPFDNSNSRQTNRAAASTDITTGMVDWFKVRADGTVALRATLAGLQDLPKGKIVFPGYRALASKMIGYLERSGVTVRVVDNLDVSGRYRGGPHDVLLRRNRGNNNYVLMHELVHAATSRWIRMNPTHPLVRQLENINTALRKAIGEEHYGVTDVHELASEVMTNPLFAERAKGNMVAERLIDRAVATIKNILRGEFKIAPKQYDALQRAVENVGKIMDKQMDPDFKWDSGKAAKNLPPMDVQTLTGRPPQMDNAARGVVNNPETSTSSLAIPDKQRAAYDKIPGLAGLKDYISRDVDVDLVKDLILKSKDLANSLTGAIASKEMIASIKNHPAIYAAGQYFTNARKRAELYHSNVLKPLEDSVMKLARTEKASILADAFKAEMFAKKRLTDSELRMLGLGDPEIQIYHDFRKEFDVAIDRVNERRLATGQDPITPHEAYLSSRWRGNWKTPVFDKKGRLVYFIAETSKGKAQHALAWLEKNVPDIDVSKSKIEHRKQFFLGEESLSMATHKDLIRMLGADDPLVQHLDTINNARLEAEAEGTIGFNKHFEPKAGTRGFLGDRPWVNDKTNTRDLLQSQLDYLRNAHMWTEFQTATDKMNAIIGDSKIQEHAPNLVEVLQDIKKAEMGNGTLRGLKSIESGISEALGHTAAWLGEGFPPLKHLPTDLSAINKGMGLAKSYFYISKLGIMNVPFTTMSLVQPVFSIPHHMQLTNKGYEHNMAKTWADSLGAGTAASINLLRDAPPPKWFSEIQKEAYNYMKANGIGDLNQFSESHDMGRSQAYLTAKKVAGWNMTESERMARSWTFMGLVSHLEQSGKFKDKHMMFQTAEMITNKAMANYRHTERAGMFNKGGFVGNAAATLNTFKVNQYNQVVDFYKHGKRTGDYTPFVAMLGTQFLLGGALGMFALDEIEDVYNLFKKGAVALGANDKGFLAWSPKHALAKNLDDWASHGAFSATVGQGRNYGTRMSAANVVDPSFAGVFPFIADLWKQASTAVRVGSKAVTGEATKKDLGELVSAVAPASVKGNLSAMPELGQVDEQGNPIAKDGSIAYRRSPEEQEMMKTPFAGMQSVKENKSRELDYQYKQFKGMKAQAAQVQETRFRAALEQGNNEKATNALREYLDLDGNANQLLNSVVKDKLRRLFTADEWALINARGIDALKEILQKREYKGVR